jgi:3',5'-cyclic AMP phosphodiesterase CpdA
MKLDRMLLFLAMTLPAAARGVTLTRAPFVQLGTESSILIAWKTAEAADSTVEYGTDETYDRRASDPAAVTQHAVALAGLMPATRYFYRVLSGGELLAEGKSFTTAPDPAAPSPSYRFVVFGDTGGGTQAQLDVAARVAASNPDFVIHIGDLAYPGGIPADLDTLYFDVYRDLIAGTVVFTATGNKEVESDDGAAYLDAFYMPENGPILERCYSFVRGNALFIALDSNSDLSPESAQHEWLEAQLAASDRFWKFVFFHHPLYGSANAEFIPRGYLEPLLNENKVDLVFQGHTHFYDRSFPILDGAVTDRASEPDYIDPQGTVYVVTGGGGGKLVTAAPKSFSARYKSTYHHVVISIEDNELTLTAIESTGDVLDTMTITKKKREPAPVFHRGDADGNGKLELTDAVRVLGFLFLGTPMPDCLEAADSDDNGTLQLTDAVRVLSFLFTGGDPPAPPGPPPAECGADPAGSPDLGCSTYTRC